MWRRDDGQSLVEVALSLPILLLILLALADLGRVYYHSSALTNAAREGAAFAARTPGASEQQVLQRTCDETGLAPHGQPCAGLRVATMSGADRVTVDAAYEMSLVSSFLVGAVFRVDPVTIRASATFPVMSTATQ